MGIEGGLGLEFRSAAELARVGSRFPLGYTRVDIIVTLGLVLRHPSLPGRVHQVGVMLFVHPHLVLVVEPLSAQAAHERRGARVDELVKLELVHHLELFAAHVAGQLTPVEIGHEDALALGRRLLGGVGARDRRCGCDYRGRGRRFPPPLFTVLKFGLTEVLLQLHG